MANDENSLSIVEDYFTENEVLHRFEEPIKITVSGLKEEFFVPSLEPLLEDLRHQAEIDIDFEVMSEPLGERELTIVIVAIDAGEKEFYKTIAEVATDVIVSSGVFSSRKKFLAHLVGVVKDQKAKNKISHDFYIAGYINDAIGTVFNFVRIENLSVDEVSMKLNYTVVTSLLAASIHEFSSENNRDLATQRRSFYRGMSAIRFLYSSQLSSGQSKAEVLAAARKEFN